eukprot:CAMPEP_0115136642 /NCGR_PEP_ID=MMETSP0227-20121206/56500_1 /TAXON_ID=89957 /ORGANISM="Polarella glacialis, Strain CCMP 1383" /LENGTH=49 /DNA_ID= /DNA_START= /DNA_END= /DNA_ORIENTATION=
MARCRIILKRDLAQTRHRRAEAKQAGVRAPLAPAAAFNEDNMSPSYRPA